MISDRDLVAAAAATYATPTADFSGADGAVRVFRSVIDGVPTYAIEGTHDPLGWALDFMALPIELHASVEHPDVGFVHAGFNAALDSVWATLVAAMAKDPIYVIVGHSLGAGLAILATGRQVALGRPPVQWAAFAPPRVGFKQLLALVAKVPGHAYRNGNDPVTDVPFRALPLWVYEQVPLVRGGNVYHPPWDAHHIENYVALVSSLADIQYS